MKKLSKLLVGRALYFILGAGLTFVLIGNLTDFKRLEAAHANAMQSAYFAGCIAFVNKNINDSTKLLCSEKARVYRIGLDRFLEDAFGM